jgi:hypothetical protein
MRVSRSLSVPLALSSAQAGSAARSATEAAAATPKHLAATANDCPTSSPLPLRSTTVARRLATADGFFVEPLRGLALSLADRLVTTECAARARGRAQ